MRYCRRVATIGPVLVADFDSKRLARSTRAPNRQARARQNQHALERPLGWRDGFGRGARAGGATRPWRAGGALERVEMSGTLRTTLGSAATAPSAAPSVADEEAPPPPPPFDFAGRRAWLARADSRLGRVLGAALRDVGCDVHGVRTCGEELDFAAETFLAEPELYNPVRDDRDPPVRERHPPSPRPRHPPRAIPTLTAPSPSIAEIRGEQTPVHARRGRRGDDPPRGSG